MATDMMTQLAALIQGGMPADQAVQYLRDMQSDQFAKMSVKEQIGSNIARSAGRVGQGLLRAAGVEDPMLAQASQMRELATQFDTSTADGMMQYAKALQKINPALAQQAATKSREMALTEAKIGAEKALTTQREREKEGIDPRQQFIRSQADKYTPQSLQRFSETGRYQDLELITKADKGVKPPADFLAVAVELGYGEKANIGDYSAPEVKAINQTLLDRSTKKAAAGASNVQVGIPGIDKAKDVLDFRDKLNTTVKPYRDSINAADNAISLLNEGMKTNNFAAVAAAQRGLAKAAGETQISAADVKAFGGDPSLIGSIADVTSRLVTGTPTADTLKKMKIVAQIIKKKNEERLKDEEKMAKRTATRAGTIKPEDIEDIFQLKPSQPKQITLKSGIVVTRED